MQLPGAQPRFDAVPDAAFEGAVVDADLRIAARTGLRVFGQHFGCGGAAVARRAVGAHVVDDHRHLVREALGLAPHVREDELRVDVRSELDAALRDLRQRRDRPAERRRDGEPDRAQPALVHDRARPLAPGKEL